MFINGGILYTRRHIGYNYDIIGKFEIVEDTETFEREQRTKQTIKEAFERAKKERKENYERI